MRRAIVALLIAANPCAAQGQADPAGQAAPPVVVVGKRQDEALAALKACVERRCPADQDIAATLAVAKGQFLAGDYRASRGTLLAARHRTGGAAKAFPVEVASLQRAISRVGEHIGDGNMAWSGKLDQVSALKAGLPWDDAQVYLARIAVADGYVAQERFRAAVDSYEEVARTAAAVGLTDVEGLGLYRSASLQVRMAQRGMAEWTPRAEHALDAILARPEPGLAPFVTAARALRIQWAASKPDADIDALVARFRPAGPTATPQLLYAPIVGLNTASDAGRGNREMQANALLRQSMERFDDQWIDLAFDIFPDGRVRNVRIEQQSPTLAGTWPKLVMTAVEGRRYAPMRIADGPSVLKRERYSFTSTYETKTGSRIRNRSATPKLEVLELASAH